jgi:hypothetical protein
MHTYFYQLKQVCMTNARHDRHDRHDPRSVLKQSAIALASPLLLVLAVLPQHGARERALMHLVGAIRQAQRAPTHVHARQREVVADARTAERLDGAVGHAREHVRLGKDAWEDGQFVGGDSDSGTIVVATQVVEVGLNISAGVLHTELAPANSLASAPAAAPASTASAAK